MKKRLFSSVIFILAQCIAISTLLAQVSVDVKTDAQKITVGDQIRYFVTATIDTTQSQLRWATFPDTFNTLEIVEKGKIDTTRNGSTIICKQRLLLTGFDSGSFLIPRFLFLATDKTGKVDSFYTDSFHLAVSTVPVDTTQAFKAIKGIAEVQTSWLDNLPLILGSLVALTLVVLVILYFLKNKKVAQQKKENEIVETYHERMLRLLDELDKRELWQKDKVKEYYTELSEIIRQYIEIRFKTPAMELTTDELLRKAKKHREMTSFSSSLKPLLQAADLAKFAKAIPLPEEHIEALTLAKNFIQITKPKEDFTQNNLPQSQSQKK